MDSYGEESRRMHWRLYRIIGDQLPTGSQEFSRFKHAIPLCPRDKEHNCGSAEQLLEIWERRGGVYLGHYGKLLALLEDTELISIRNMARTQIDKIGNHLRTEKCERDFTAEEAPSPPNKYPSTDDALHSHDSPPKDHLKLIQYELQHWYSEVMRCLRPIQWSVVALDLDHIYTNLEIVPGIKQELSKGSQFDEIPTVSSIFNTSTNERIVSFIEGAAGMGKSTLCKHLVYLWSKNNFSVLGHSFSLIFLLEAHMLKGDFKTCINEHLFPKDFALSENNIYECLLYHREQCLLIIDGVDELTPEGINTVMDILNGTKLRRVNLVLTGRLEASMQFVNIVKLHLKLTGYTVENVLAYVSKHLDSDDDKLLNRLKTDPTLQEIMMNPLIAVLVCLLVEDKGTIPATSSEIQNEVLHLICKQYVNTRKEVCESVHLTKEDLLSTACQFAYNGLKQGIIRYPEQTLASFCSGFSEHLLKAGLLNKNITLSRLDPEDFCSFPHKSFQEILCAKYLAEFSVENLKNELVPSSKLMQSERSMIFMLIEMLQCEDKIKVVYESLKKWQEDKRCTEQAFLHEDPAY